MTARQASCLAADDFAKMAFSCAARRVRIGLIRFEADRTRPRIANPLCINPFRKALARKKFEEGLVRGGVRDRLADRAFGQRTGALVIKPRLKRV